MRPSPRVTPPLSARWTWPFAGLREKLTRAFAQLDGDPRKAVVLKHVENLSHDEISVITGASVSALKMRVSRACARLRDLLTVAR